MTRLSAASVAIGGALLLAACASVPNGPSIMALPGSGKTFEQFQFDDMQCRDFAQVQIGGTAQASADNAAVRSAAVGTAVGAVAGAVIGGHQGAGVGAGTGLVVGSMAGADSGYSAGYGSQRRYDNAYVQCMYAKGEKVPVSASFVQPQAPAPAPSSGGYPPPPPPGYAPPR
jgi:outer membrane lipoprotein SlyB